MDMIYYCLITAFLISFLICGSEIAFGKYKLNHTLVLRRPKYLIIYGLMNGILSVLVIYVLVNSDLQLNDYQPKDYPWAVSITVALTIRSIAKISLYTFIVGDKPVSVGPKIVIDFLEDFILKKINDNVDDQLVVEIHNISKEISKGRTLRDQNILIGKAMPTGFNAITKASYLKEIEELKNSFDKCRYFANKFGVQRLNLLKELMK